MTPESGPEAWESRLDDVAIPPPAHEPVPTARPPRAENPVLSWARAVFGGIQDTAHDVAREARAAAARTSESRWQDYEAKTKHRRRPKPEPRKP